MSTKNVKIQQNAVTYNASSLELEKRDQFLKKAYYKISDAPMFINSDLCWPICWCVTFADNINSWNRTIFNIKGIKFKK